MASQIILSSQLNDSYVGQLITIRGRVFHKEKSKDNQKTYIYIRDDIGLLTAIFETKKFSIIDTISLETFILVSGMVQEEKQPFITKYSIIGTFCELLSPLSDNLEPLMPMISTIRFLYIRRLEIKTLLLLKRFIRKQIILFLEEQGFQPVETPVITSFTQVNRQAIRVTTNKKNDILEGEKYLIQKSQFYLEAFAHTFGKVYTLTPAFRADHRESDLLLAEFWLLEVEEIFSNIEDKMDLLQSLVKWITRKLIENQAKEIRELIVYREISKIKNKKLVIHSLEEDFWNQIELLYENQIEFLNKILKSKDFPRLKYENIIKEFNNKDEYFQTTHLRERRGEVLTSKYDSPVFVTEFPFELRHFYDKKYDNSNYTVTFDLIGHGKYGEIASGSEREYRANIIEEQMYEKKLRKENNQTLQWYYKLQKFGSVPHAGFSIGLERLTAWLTQTENISDIIGFPRRIKGNEINY